MTYAERNLILAGMGYASYEDYLKTQLWALIREKAVVKHGSDCMTCGRLYSQIHHLSYSRNVLLGIDINGVVPVCGGCHQKIEFDSRGNKRTIKQALTAYRSMRKAWKKGKPGKRRKGSRPELGLRHKHKHLRRKGYI